MEMRSVLFFVIRQLSIRPDNFLARLKSGCCGLAHLVWVAVRDRPDMCLQKSRILRQFIDQFVSQMETLLTAHRALCLLLVDGILNQ